ncbi:MAG: hypothetical protein ACTSWN_13065 [Promethearchaeota archaeon]
MVCGEILFSYLMVDSTGKQKSSDKINVLYLAPTQNIEDSNILKALEIDNRLNVTIKADGSSSFNNFDCIVYCSDLELNASEISKLLIYTSNGGKLLLISSLQLTLNPAILVSLEILTNESTSSNQKDAIVNVVDDAFNHPLISKIEFNSIPEFKNYTVINRNALNPDNMTILLERFLQVEEEAAGEVKDPLLIEKYVDAGHVLFFAGYLGGDESLNKHVKLWPYFNYMVYSSICYLSGRDFETYGNWPYSPVPHEKDQLTISIYVACMLVIAIGIYILMRRYSKRTRINKETLQAAAVEKKSDSDPQVLELDEGKKRFIADLMASSLSPEEIEKELDKVSEVDLTDKWEQIGPHRQIGGFLFGFFMGVILIIPQLLITGYLFPQIILPFPQVTGWFDLTKNFFNAIWIAFDVGTSVALAKYFSEHRVLRPEKAVHYIQIFVWWQMMSGIVQISMVALIGAFIYPHTYLAHLSWMFILHSLIQYPGFFLVFQYVFQGMQRTDYQLVTQLFYNIVFNILFQIGTILLCRWIFAQMPRFGEEFGAGIGYVIGQYLAEWGTFFFTVALFKRMGFSVRSIFRIDFTYKEFKQALWFGFKFMIGNVWVPAVWLWQVFLQSIYVKGYATETGYFNLIFTFGNIISVVALFMEGLLAGVSEAHSHRKESLLKLHTVQGLKWANFMTFFLVTLLFMLGERFVIGFSGPEWKSAIKFIPLVLLFQLLGPYSWQGDKMLSGTDNNGLLAVAWIIEQSTRAILLFALIPRFQMIGVLMAYIPALIAKNMFLWVVIKKKITNFKPYFWVVWISPALSAACVYLLMEFVIAPLIWSGDLITTAILFLIAIFGGFYLYSFISGVLGHWDDNTLYELDKATKMVKIVGFLARSMFKSIRAGTKISVLHGKYPIDIYNDAIREAHELEIEKRILKI